MKNLKLLVLFCISLSILSFSCGKDKYKNRLRVEKIMYFDNKSETEILLYEFFYDGGKVTHFNDKNGDVHTLTYGQDGKVIKKVLSQLTAETTTIYSYNSLGKVVKSDSQYRSNTSSENYLIEYFYDSAGRIVESKNNSNQVWYYKWEGDNLAEMYSKVESGVEYLTYDDKFNPYSLLNGLQGTMHFGVLSLNASNWTSAAPLGPYGISYNIPATIYQHEYNSQGYPTIIRGGLSLGYKFVYSEY